MLMTKNFSMRFLNLDNFTFMNHIVCSKKGPKSEIIKNRQIAKIARLIFIYLLVLMKISPNFESCNHDLPKVTFEKQI